LKVKKNRSFHQFQRLYESALSQFSGNEEPIDLSRGSVKNIFIFK